MWSEQTTGGDHVVSGHPQGWSNSSAAALLSYDVSHRAPWDWRVSLYTWTKAIAAGVYLVPLLLILAGFISWDSDIFTWVAPITGLLFLAITGGLLIADLSHPRRFYMIFTRPQWSSWLVKGGFLIAGYGGVLTLHLLATLLELGSAHKVLALPGVPLSIMAAVYTAYLFAQSKGRDMWQSPLLPPHMFVQMTLAGSAVLLLLAPVFDEAAVTPLAFVLAAGVLVHLLMVWGEVTLAHPTAHAHLAVWEMTRGRFGSFFWVGVALVAVGLTAPLIGPLAGLMALAGLFAYEHAYVQSAQAVPLA